MRKRIDKSGFAFLLLLIVLIGLILSIALLDPNRELKRIAPALVSPAPEQVQPVQ